MAFTFQVVDTRDAHHEAIAHEAAKPFAVVRVSGEEVECVARYATARPANALVSRRINQRTEAQRHIPNWK